MMPFPLFPSQGSVGASGDFSSPYPICFCRLLVLGKVNYEGKNDFHGRIIQKKTGLKHITTWPQRRFSLDQWNPIYCRSRRIGGFKKLQALFTTGGYCRCYDVWKGLQGSIKPFFEELHATSPLFKGNQHVAGRIRTLVQGSEIFGGSY